MNISIIGAGIGGLSSACLLAAKGHKIEVFEKNESAGGKMNELKEDGFRFDTGPSLLTMPFVLQRLYEECGTSLHAELELLPLDPICTYFYQDGTTFTNYEDHKATLKEIERIAPEDLEAYEQFLGYAQALYHRTADAFIFNPLYDFSDFRQLNLLSFFGIDAFTTVSQRIDSMFTSSYLRQFFKRFTTYNGSSPYQAPATLHVIPHVEINLGGHYIKGGLYTLAESLEALARSLGVNFHYGAGVTTILTKNKKAQGLKLENGEEIYSDLVLSNSDVTETITQLLPDEAIPTWRKQQAESIEPSCSGFVLMLGIDRKYEHLSHHNIFFSEDYETEFRQIFREKVMPEDPTIYVANTSHSDHSHAPEGGSNLFILVNAPYLSDQYDWETNKKAYGDNIITELEKRGLENLSAHIQFRENITPEDFYEKYRSNKGSIYGTSSNSKFSAFIRPRNKSRNIEGLYFTGGSTHPGGGIPLVIQSAFNAANLIERYEE
ncbi:MAG TPA: phytoene desaturase [Balneolaceae bacterium]|nr:phytoene desaturase [Balneolaceae bacterium]